MDNSLSLARNPEEISSDGEDEHLQQTNEEPLTGNAAAAVKVDFSDKAAVIADIETIRLSELFEQLSVAEEKPVGLLQDETAWKKRSTLWQMKYEDAQAHGILQKELSHKSQEQFCRNLMSLSEKLLASLRRSAHFENYDALLRLGKDLLTKYVAKEKFNAALVLLFAPRSTFKSPKSIKIWQTQEHMFLYDADREKTCLSSLIPVLLTSDKNLLLRIINKGVSTMMETNSLNLVARDLSRWFGLSDSSKAVRYYQATLLAYFLTSTDIGRRMSQRCNLSWLGLVNLALAHRPHSKCWVSYVHRVGPHKPPYGQ
ncbi:uncharacterized protein MONBRDRAFT_6794 [Monosiga brevicollis MX1]|uniref:Uncharacterized protein n=1 Tax=Monosiga brevicollis TaxID=81824 RepID=A9UVB8_MONBE|nr:uncharacterized protein MONBRDRAFT_6794 [Monosiga brevicollis MX1]EDQ90866.1 predicted protein [Monosiga brevicollis MX1]|eukprot:XP_001744163.1 hypothetical protein [Monosiga brevicollis MX1]